MSIISSIFGSSLHNGKPPETMTTPALLTKTIEIAPPPAQEATKEDATRIIQANLAHAVLDANLRGRIDLDDFNILAWEIATVLSYSNEGNYSAAREHYDLAVVVLLDLDDVYPERASYIQNVRDMLTAREEDIPRLIDGLKEQRVKENVKISPKELISGQQRIITL